MTKQQTTPDYKAVIDMLNHVYISTNDAKNNMNPWTGNRTSDVAAMKPEHILQNLADAAGALRIATRLAVEAQRASETPPSWATIGDALGMTRQAAQQKYGRAL